MARTGKGRPGEGDEDDVGGGYSFFFPLLAARTGDRPLS